MATIKEKLKNLVAKQKKSSEIGLKAQYAIEQNAKAAKKAAEEIKAQRAQ